MKSSLTPFERAMLGSIFGYTIAKAFADVLLAIWRL